MKNEKKENQFVKITGILRAPGYGTNFGFLSKMELSDPLKTYKVIHSDNYGDEFIEFLESQIDEREEGAEFNISYEIYEVESKLGDQYEDDCRENGARVYLVSESITEEEFNNSDKWNEPTEEECRKLLVNRYDD